MSDLIDRQAAIDALKEHRALYCDNTPDTFSKLSYAEKSRVDELDTAIATLVNLPPAQPERIKGHWIESAGQNILLKKLIEKGETWRVCDKCGAGFMIGYQYECDKAYHETFHNFCPKCGADMRGEQNG